MSAFIVDKATIDAILTVHLALMHLDDGSNEPPACSEGLAAIDRLGAMLWRENYRSVNARYRERKRAPSYRFQAVPYDPKNLRCAIERVHGALRGYRYQSCEHDEWEKSRACAFVDGMLLRIAIACPKCSRPGHMCDDEQHLTSNTMRWTSNIVCMHGSVCEHDWRSKLDARGTGLDISDHNRNFALMACGHGDHTFDECRTCEKESRAEAAWEARVS